MLTDYMCQENKVEDSVDASIQRLVDNIQKHGGNLITATG